MIVLDASVALEVLLRMPAGIALEERLFSPAETLHAPHLLDVEVAQVLRRYALIRAPLDQPELDQAQDVGVHVLVVPSL